MSEEEVVAADPFTQGRGGILAVAVDHLLDGGQRVGGPAQLAGMSSGNVDRHPLSANGREPIGRHGLPATARRTPTSAATVDRGDENVVPLWPPGIGYMGNT